MSGIVFLSISLLAEGFIYLVVAGLLFMMNLSLGYKYQQYWAYSWFAYAVYLTLAGFNVYLHTTNQSLGDWKLALSASAQWFNYMKLYWLMIGTLVLCKNINFEKRFHLFWLIALILPTVLIAASFNYPGMAAYRYFTRVALPALFTMIVVLYCAYQIYRSIDGKWGATLFAVCLSIHGLQQSVLVFEGINFLFGTPPSGFTTTLYALADFFLQTVLAMGLVAWIIQNEREKVSESEGKLKAIAQKDALTGLPNRLWLEKQFIERFPDLIGNEQKAAFVFIDLDGFKMVNDSLGHSMGDKVLQEVSKRLQSAARSDDLICRLGGDEFVWVLPILQDRSVVLDRAEQFRIAIESIDQVDGHSISISCSMGLSWYPDQGRDLDNLTRKSDHAMYEAKKQGKNQVVAIS